MASACCPRPRSRRCRRYRAGDVQAGWDIGDAFGLTWEVTKDPIGTLTGLSLGAFHTTAALSPTFGYVDLKKDLIGVYMTQWNGPDGNIPRETFRPDGRCVDYRVGWLQTCLARPLRIADGRCEGHLVQSPGCVFEAAGHRRFMAGVGLL